MRSGWVLGVCAWELVVDGSEGIVGAEGLKDAGGFCLGEGEAVGKVPRLLMLEGDGTVLGW